MASFHRIVREEMSTVKSFHPCPDPADKCVLDSCRYLQNRGFDVTYLPVKKDGLIDMKQLQEAIRPDTGIISVMMVNNEIGRQFSSNT